MGLWEKMKQLLKRKTNLSELASNLYQHPVTQPGEEGSTDNLPNSSFSRLWATKPICTLGATGKEEKNFKSKLWFSAVFGRSSFIQRECSMG